MPVLTSRSRPHRIASLLRLFAALALGGGAAAPAMAEEAPVPAAPVETPADGLIPDADEPARHLQDVSDIDDEILLPAARDDDDDGERKWSRNYISVAGGILSSPDYNGSDERRLLPAFYVRLFLFDPRHQSSGRPDPPPPRAKDRLQIRPDHQPARRPHR